ncbi:uncharacterized protein AAG666_006343 [Megaptera novaeangliae]
MGSLTVRYAHVAVTQGSGLSSQRGLLPVARTPPDRSGITSLCSLLSHFNIRNTPPSLLSVTSIYPLFTADSTSPHLSHDCPGIPQKPSQRLLPAREEQSPPDGLNSGSPRARVQARSRRTGGGRPPAAARALSPATFRALRSPNLLSYFLGKPSSQKPYPRRGNRGAQAHKVKQEPALCARPGSSATRSPRGPTPQRAGAHPPWPRPRPAPRPRSRVPTRRRRQRQRRRRRSPGADPGAARQRTGNTPERRSPASAWWTGRERAGPGAPARLPRGSALSARAARGPRGAAAAGAGPGSALPTLRAALPAGAREATGSGQSLTGNRTSERPRPRPARRGEARAREDGAPLGGSARASGSEGGRAETPREARALRRPRSPRAPALPFPAAGRAGWPGGRAAGAAARPGSAGRGAARRRAQGQGMADAPSACAYVRESGRGRERAEPGRPPLALSSEAAPRAPGRAARRPSPRPSPRSLTERGPGRGRRGGSGALAPRREVAREERARPLSSAARPWAPRSRGGRSPALQKGREKAPGGIPARWAPRGPGRPNEGRPRGEGPRAQTRGRCGRSNWLLTEKLRGGVAFREKGSDGETRVKHAVVGSDKCRRRHYLLVGKAPRGRLPGVERRLSHLRQRSAGSVTPLPPVYLKPWFRPGREPPLCAAVHCPV